jgi:hypothetical protein
MTDPDDTNTSNFIVPNALNMNPTYENFEADCPYCKRRNIFNRASDLGTFALIPGRNINCLYDDCSKKFRISGDLINGAWEMMFGECYELLDRKHYMNCILTVAQIYEIFFATFLRAQLLYKPYVFEGDVPPQVINNLNEKLRKKTKKFAYEDMRNIVTYCILNEIKPANMHDAEKAIDALPDKVQTLADDNIEKIKDKDAEIAAKLLLLKRVTVHETRNRIVHKDAFRPTKEQAYDAHKEAGDILFWFKQKFDISHDPVWYQITQRGKP